MEFLSAIGTAIVGTIAEYTVGPVVRQISYVTGCEVNLQQLKDAVEKLKADRHSVANEVEVAGGRGERIQPNVELWLEKVARITEKTDQLFQDETPAELKCFRGGFCCNLKIRHRISRKSTKLLREVVKLDEKRGFSAVSCGILRQEPCSVSTGDYLAFTSRTSTVKKIMDELKNPNSKRIGVFGIGGVGKTTLAKQVYRQATEEEKHLFDEVVFLLDVKENPDLEGIQKKIVEKLGMKISEPEGETMDGRASRLCARIKDKKTLVILDDVWEEIKLEAVGIPSMATCKILLTSRSKKALSAMSTDEEFELSPLEDKDTWDLFESKAGNVVKDPAIRKVATQIAECCKGLPVLVVTVASTLKKRASLPLWEDALRCLQEGSNDQKLTEKANSGLEWSYSQLNDKELQQFFLLCGIVTRGNKIILTDLLRYGMGLGFLGKLSTLKEARNKVLSLVEELKDFCLLIEDENSEYVRMHDLVRDVANRIALSNHILSSVVDGGGRELKEWSDKDFLEKCTIISLPCGNNISRLPKVLQCQDLKMLLLQGDRDDVSLTVLPTFFQEMKQLSVLALEKMHFPSLPSSVQSLKNVQTLCLESCNLGDIALVGELSSLEILSFACSNIKALPKEIAQLTHLRLLDLSNCFFLQRIWPGVLSSLSSLEDLRMNMFKEWKAEHGGYSASILELKHLSQLTSLQINIPNANILPANLFSSFELERYQIVFGHVIWKSVLGDPDNETHNNTLKIVNTIQLDKGLKMLLKKSQNLYLDGAFGHENTLDHQLDTEDFQQLKDLRLEQNSDFTYIINRKVVFPSLTTLDMHRCDGLRFLFSSSMARSLVELKRLTVRECKDMKEIVLSTRGEDGEENMDNLFPMLQSLRLHSLPKLVTFCTSSYIEFSSLEELELYKCDELESFICGPLNSGEKDREETTLQYSLFNEKVGCRSLERLNIEGLRKLKTLFVAHQDSFCRLKDVARSEGLINMFPPSIMGRLNALKTIQIIRCESLEVVFDVKAETAYVNTSSSKPFYCRNLESVVIRDCDSLQNIFLVAVARGLHELTVTGCAQPEGIIGVEAGVLLQGPRHVVPGRGDAFVGKKGGGRWDSIVAKFATCSSMSCSEHSIISQEVEGVIENPSYELVFPNVSSLVLANLPQLKCFYTAGMHTSKWPSLERLELYDVPCKLFAPHVSFFREKHEQMDPETTDRPLFLIHKDSFPQLKILILAGGIVEIWYGDGPSPADFFPELERVYFYRRTPFSKQAALVFLKKLPKLEAIEVSGDHEPDEIFVGDSSGEIYALPRVRSLRLCRMYNLLHLGNQEKSQSAAATSSPVPNLKFLELDSCLRLNSLSAIPFRCLTRLKVRANAGLKYLISYSVAKTLVQLKRVEVVNCVNIEFIIATDGDDDDDAAGNHEIVYFNCTWQYLKLRYLWNLRGFSSPNCIVKFPSLETFQASEDINLKIDEVQVVRIS